MKKNISTGKQLFLCLLLTAVALYAMTPQISFTVYAQEADPPDADPPDDMDMPEETSISLTYASSITIDTDGSIVRIYGAEDTEYSVPIDITADCTVILDHVNNPADLSVADGTTVNIVLRGTNTLNHILAKGGTQTQLSITGESSESMLTANNIACPDGGSAASGAEVLIENCSVTCSDLGCGNDGRDATYTNGSAAIANSLPGSNASPYITIRSANLVVNGDIACGGNGVQSLGTWSAHASHGGTSGEVMIDSSQVTVSGNIAIGGKGGAGRIGSSYYSCGAGNTRSASPVTICNHSSVIVSGNVATQQDLPSESNEGNQAGLNGVTVTVSESSLTAKDIASGGDGHQQVHYEVYSGSGCSYNIYGTAGGKGGTLIADHAQITCETAVCGGNAGSYTNYSSDMSGQKSGDYDSVGHPLDGNGGVIQADSVDLTVTTVAAEKGSRWNDYANASVYSDHSFVGGTLNGVVYGNVIRIDLTSVLSGDFMAQTDIRNSEDSSCAGCVLQTSEDLAGQTVQVFANDLSAVVTLDETGSLHTYLDIGKEVLKVSGTAIYAGTHMVKRSSLLNTFQLEPYGRICMENGDAVISEHAYSCMDKVYDYAGAYTITGSSENAVLTVESGSHLVTLNNASFSALTVKGTSEVTLQPNEYVQIGTVHVASGAMLKVSGIDDIHAAPDTFSIGQCNGIMRNEAGQRMLPVDFRFEIPGTYRIKLNEKELTVKTDDAGLANMLLAEGEYEFLIDCDPFYFRDNLTITNEQQICQSDLTLFVDASAGDLVVGEQTIALGEAQIQTNAKIYVSQSSDDLHAIYVEKNDAEITFDHCQADMNICLPENFAGRITNSSGAAIQSVTIQTGYPNRELTLHLDGQDYVIQTDSDGTVSFFAASGAHSVEITVDDTTYRSVRPLTVSDSPTENSFSIQDDMTDDPAMVETTDPDIVTDGDTDRDNDKNTDTGDQTAFGRADTDTVIHPDASHAQTHVNYGSSDATVTVSESASQKPNGFRTQASSSVSSDSAIQVTHEATAAPSINIQTSLKGISLLSTEEKNTYSLYTRKNITFTIARDKDTDYYYKILRKGQKKSEEKWKKLLTDNITIAENESSVKGQRIVLKAVNQAGSIIKKTTGFVIDTTKPAVDGVKNAGFYPKKRTITVSDNCGSCEVRLNGKKMKETFTVQKRGIYLLTASDPAGNRRSVLFAML